MATAREESGYGKIKKRPFRRQTPYDRPSTALRNPTNVNLNNNHGTGWLSKLVDPAQRIIVSSAHRLFGSLFRKRLPPPPLPPTEPGENLEAKDTDKEQVSTDHPGVEGAVTGPDIIDDSSDKGGLTELEQILKQKTFTRSEIDRLATLLYSRSADMPVGDEQKIPEVIPPKPVVLHNRVEASFDTPAGENGIVNQLVATPVVSSTVVDNDIASPAELAKAYMGSRPSKVSPSMLGLRGQAFREESTVLSNQPLHSASSIMSLVPRSSRHVGVPENGFVTPGSRGRSAIYSMARTPYSRINSSSTFKGARVAINSGAGPSSSQSTWEKNRLTGSREGILKRRISVVDNDIGSIGPIRRIRQKPNLLSSKNLNLPASGSPLSVRGSDVTDAVQYPSSSMQKPLISVEPKHGFTKVLRENGDNSTPSTSSIPVPSKSSETASKILQQLDKLVSPREKSPTKLSPSMLHGPALKSLENVDSSILLENVQDNRGSNGSLNSSLPDVKDSTSQKQDKVEANGPTKFFSPFGKSILTMNGVDAAGVIKDNVLSTKSTDSALTNTTTHSHPQKKQAFQMSAHEDYLELDDDDISNGPASMPLADGRDKPNGLFDKITATEPIREERYPAHSDFKSLSPELNKTSDKENIDGAVAAGKSSVFTISTVPSPNMIAKPAEVATQSTMTSNKAGNKSSCAPIFSFGEKVTPTKESNAVSPTFSTTTTNVDKVAQFASAPSYLSAGESSPFKFGAPLNSKPESSTSLASVTVDSTDSARKVPESDKADNGFLLKTTSISLPSAASTSSSTASIFSFGAPTHSSSLDNGSLSSYPSSTSSPSPPVLSSSGFNQASFGSSTVSFAATTSGATSTTSTLATTPAVAPIFKFGSSAVPSTSSSPMSATSGVESMEAKKNGTCSGNSTSMIFSSVFVGAGSSTSGTSSLANTSTGSSIFGNTSSAFTSTGSSMFGGTSPSIRNTGGNSFDVTSSTVGNTGSGIFGFSVGTSSSAPSSQAQASNPFSASAQSPVDVSGIVTKTESLPTQFGSSVTKTESLPTQFGSSVTSTSFGLAANPTFSSSNSLFGSSTSAAVPFGSAPSFGLTSSTSSSDTNTVSFSSGSATTSVFGSTWQTPKPPAVFGSGFNSASPSNVFMFGASASSTASASTPVFGSSASSAAGGSTLMFGSSGSASSSSFFPFTSSITAASSQPAFGNTNPAFAFGSPPSNNNNNDQMNMEDSMAEDTVPASTPPVPAFGQQSVTPPSSFVFGSTAPSGASPFQFGSQQNMATPQNPSPFQASGSLDFNAGGSFSLGTTGDKSQRKIVKLNRKARKK